MKLAAAINTIDLPPYNDDVARPLVMSGLFHFLLLLLAIWGLPYMKPELPDFENAISIEIVQLDEKTQTTKPQVEKRVEPPKTTPKPKPEQVRKKPPPPTVKSEKMPRPVKPKPPQIAEEVKLNPAVKPVEKPAAEQKAAEEKSEDFLALLKNLEEHEPDEKSLQSPLLTGAAQEKFIPLGDRMTMNETQAVLQRLGECWNIMAGARYAEELVIEMTIYMNPDRTIRNARIHNQLRYNGDSYFRAAADSALRALGHQNCQTLPLPLGKYEQWKEITVTFDPREMLQ